VSSPIWGPRPDFCYCQTAACFFLYVGCPLSREYGSDIYNSKSKLCYDRRSVGQSVLVSSTHLGPKTRFLLLSDSCGAPSLTKGRVCRLQLLLPSPAQSFSGPSPAGLIIFYCLRFETSLPGGPGPRIYIPQEQRGPVIPPGTGFPCRRLLRLAGLLWRYSNPPPRRVLTKL
jgi:hypothetical protein